MTFRSVLLLAALGWVVGALAPDAGRALDVIDPGLPSRANGLADTALVILFEVDRPRPYALGLSLSAALDQLTLFDGGSASALVETTARLTGTASGSVFDAGVFDELADGTQVREDYAIEGVLAPDTYLLEIVSLADLRGFENAAGFASTGFGVRFSIVPEPGTATLVGLGLGALAAGRPRREGRPSSPR